MELTWVWVLWPGVKLRLVGGGWFGGWHSAVSSFPFIFQVLIGTLTVHVLSDYSAPDTCGVLWMQQAGSVFLEPVVELTEVSNPRPTGRTQLRMAANVGQPKIVNLVKTFWNIFVITCRNVFNVWPKTTLLPLWPRDTKRLGPLV